MNRRKHKHTHMQPINLVTAIIQNICNLIGLEEYSNDRITLPVSILYPLTRQRKKRIKKHTRLS